MQATTSRLSLHRSDSRGCDGTGSTTPGRRSRTARSIPSSGNSTAVIQSATPRGVEQERSRGNERDYPAMTKSVTPRGIEHERSRGKERDYPIPFRRK